MTKGAGHQSVAGSLVSVSEYSAFRGVTPQAIRKAIKEGRIKAEKIGKQWVIRVKV